MCGSRSTFAARGAQTVRWFAGLASVKPSDVKWVTGAEFKRAFPDQARGFAYDFMKLIPVADGREYAIGAVGSSVRPITRRVIFTETDRPTKCGAMCRNAKGPMCDCSCKGENHGAGVSMSRKTIAKRLDRSALAEIERIGEDYGQRAFRRGIKGYREDSQAQAAFRMWSQKNAPVKTDPSGIPDNSQSVKAFVAFTNGWNRGWVDAHEWIVKNPPRFGVGDLVGWHNGARVVRGSVLRVNPYAKPEPEYVVELHDSARGAIKQNLAQSSLQRMARARFAEGFKGFVDPWASMNPEDRREAGRLSIAALKAMPSSPRQNEIRAKLNAILAKYGLDKPPEQRNKGTNMKHGKKAAMAKFNRSGDYKDFDGNRVTVEESGNTIRVRYPDDPKRSTPMTISEFDAMVRRGSMTRLSRSGAKAAFAAEATVHSFGDGWEVIQRHSGYTGKDELVLQRRPAAGFQPVLVKSIAEAKAKHDAITNWIFRATIVEKKPGAWLIRASDADGAYSIGGRGGVPFPSAQKASEELKKMQANYRRKAGMSRLHKAAMFGGPTWKNLKVGDWVDVHRDGQHIAYGPIIWISNLRMVVATGSSTGGEVAVKATDQVELVRAGTASQLRAAGFKTWEARPGKKAAFAANNVDLWNFLAQSDFVIARQSPGELATLRNYAKKALTLPDFTPPAMAQHGPSLHDMAKDTLADIKKWEEAVARRRNRAPWNMSRLGAKSAFSQSAAWIAKYLPALNQWWRDRTDHPTDLDASSERWEIEGVLEDVAEHCREAVPREAKPSWYAAALRDVKKIPHSRKATMKATFADASTRAAFLRFLDYAGTAVAKKNLDLARDFYRQATTLITAHPELNQAGSSTRERYLDIGERITTARRYARAGAKSAFATDAEIKARSPLSRFVVEYTKLLKWDDEVMRLPQQLHFATYEAAQDWISAVERKGWFKGFGGNMEKVENATIRTLRASRPGAKAAFAKRYDAKIVGNSLVRSDGRQYQITSRKPSLPNAREMLGELEWMFMVSDNGAEYSVQRFQDGGYRVYGGGSGMRVQWDGLLRASRAGAKSAFDVASRVHDLRSKVLRYIARGGSWDGIERAQPGLADLVGDIINGRIQPTDEMLDTVFRQLHLKAGGGFSRAGAKAKMAANPHKVTYTDKSGVTQTYMVSDRILRAMNGTKKYAESVGSKPDYDSVLRLGERTGEVVRASRPGAKSAHAADPIEADYLRDIAETKQWIEKAYDQGRGSHARLLKEQLKDLERHLAEYLAKRGSKSTNAADDKVSRKIATLVREGYPQDQAAAIAYDMKRRGEL